MQWMSQWRHFGQILIVAAIGLFLAIVIGLTLFWKSQNGLFEPRLAGSISAKETAVFVRTQDRQTIARVASVYGWNLPLPTKEEPIYEAALLKTASGTVWKVSWDGTNERTSGSLLKDYGFERTVSPTSTEVLWTKVTELPVNAQGKSLMEGLAFGAHHIAITYKGKRGSISLIGADVSDLHSASAATLSGSAVQLSLGNPRAVGMTIFGRIGLKDPSLADGLLGIVRHREKTIGTAFAPLLSRATSISVVDTNSKDFLVRGAAQSEAALVKSLADLATARSQSTVRAIHFGEFERTDIAPGSSARAENVSEWSVYAFTGSTTSLFVATRGREWMASSAKIPLLTAIGETKDAMPESGLVHAVIDTAFVTRELSERFRGLSSSLRPLFMLFNLPSDGRMTLTLQESALGAVVHYETR